MLCLWITLVCVLPEIQFRKKVPTLPELLPIVKQKIHLCWGCKSLERFVKNMGYSWRICQSKRKIFYQSKHFWLIKIEEYQDKEHPIFYTDESWDDSNLTLHKCQKNEEIVGVQTNVKSANRLLMLRVGLINGFLLDAELTYWAGSAMNDCHGQMNTVKFEKWGHVVA